jgi:hypothetical protein
LGVYMYHTYVPRSVGWFVVMLCGWPADDTHTLDINLTDFKKCLAVRPSCGQGESAADAGVGKKKYLAASSFEQSHCSTSTRSLLVGTVQRGTRSARPVAAHVGRRLGAALGKRACVPSTGHLDAWNAQVVLHLQRVFETAPGRLYSSLLSSHVGRT